MFPTFYIPSAAAGLDPDMVKVVLHLESIYSDGGFDYTPNNGSGGLVYSASGSIVGGGKFGDCWAVGAVYANIRPKDYLDGSYRLDDKDWCMEGWFNHPTSEFGNGLFFTVGHPDFEKRFICDFIGSSQVRVTQFQSYAPLWTITTTFPVDTWFHFAVVRHNGKVKLYIDGVLAGESAQDAFVADYAAPQLEVISNIGNIYDAPDGYVDEVRIVMGDAVYYDEFTPPTAPFPDV